MYSPYTSGSGHQNNSSVRPRCIVDKARCTNIRFQYQYPHQPYANGYQYTQGYQTLRPPPLNTGHTPNSYSIERTSSHGSSDSGYATRAPSVASPASYQSYPVQGNYQSRQPSQQSSSYSYSNHVRPEIEVIRAAPVSSSRHKKERRLR